MTGQEMRELRERHKLSRGALGQLLGMSESEVRQAERNPERPLDDRTEARLSEWTGDGEGPAGDDLPTPPYNPGEDPPAEGEDEPEPEKRKPGRPKGSTSGPRVKRLTQWQEETAAALNGIVLGESFTFEANGVTQQGRIPGIVDLIGRIDPFDAQVVYGGFPAFSHALVKIAPRHPWLKAMLEMSTMGGDYADLLRASMAMALPIMVHHGMLGGGPANAAANGGQRAGEPAGAATAEP